MRSLLAILAIAAFAAVGCETTRGAGEDIENTGENIQEGMNASMSNDTGMNASTNMMNDSTGTGGADTGVGSGNEPLMGY